MVMRPHPLILCGFMLAFASIAYARTVDVDFTGGVNTTVRGVYITKDYWFELSEDWEFTEPSTLELRFSHTSILRRDLSTLTVAINGSAVQSIYLDATNEKNGVLITKIPAKYLKGGMNLLTIILKMRSDLRDLCEDVHNPALWTHIDRESRLEVNYEEKRVVPDLSRFPDDYANPDLLYGKSKERVHAVIIVPDRPSAAELNAWGALATLLGQTVGVGKGDFRVTTPERFNAKAETQRHLVIVGGLDFVKSFLRKQWDVPVPISEDAEAGYLVELVSPQNPYRRLLIVTGNGEGGLRLVTEHLKTPSSVKNLKGPVAVFDKPPAFEVTPEAQSEAAFVVRLQDLKLSDLMARGKFYHSITFTMPNPYVGKVKDGAFVRISMSHSELLLPQSSSLLLKVNGEPVKSIRLTKDTAPRNTWDIKIPLQYLATRWLTFEAEVFLDIGDPDCYYNHPEMAWFTLHNDTFLYLPVDTSQGETLANYPYMFLSWNRLNHVAAVLIEPITDGSLTATFNIIAFLSQSLRSPSYVEIEVARPEELSSREKNLLVIGPVGSILADTNWSQALPKELTLREGTPGSVDLLNTAGFLVLSKNPFDNSKRLLAVMGRSDGEIGLAAPYLYQKGSVEWVRGILAVVLQDKELRVLLPPTQADAVAQFDPTKIRFEEKDGKMVPVLELPKPEPPHSRNNVAYLVFFLLTPILVLLVILRLRALSKEGREGG